MPSSSMLSALTSKRPYYIGQNKKMHEHPHFLSIRQYTFVGHV